MLGVTTSCLMGVLDPLLGKLSDILGSGFIQLQDNHRGISFLRDELSTMKVALEKMSEQEEADLLASQWMSQLQELAYDAEDVIDTFILHPSNINSSNGLIENILNKFTNLWAKYKFADDIKQLKEHTLEISDRRKRYKMDHVPSPKHIPLDPRLSALFEEPRNIVGIECQTTKLVEWIMDVENPELGVLSIVGFGGLGKTTLANQVFKKATSHFDRTAFVAPSRSPNVLPILRDILIQLQKGDNLPIGDHFARMEDPQDDPKVKDLRFTELANATRNYLQDKRFCIVIDDVWGRQAWNEIRCAFPQNMKGSRIITTTRIEDIAAYCSSRNTDLVHNMIPLDTDNSRKLFLKRIFSQNEEFPAYLKTTVDNILKKWQGLPVEAPNFTKGETQALCTSLLFSVYSTDNQSQLICKNHKDSIKAR